MSGFRRVRALVATFLALWVPVLIGLPMRADPGGSAMGTVMMWGGQADDGMAGMAGMAGMSKADHHATHDVAANGDATHHHDHCCIVCPCCGAVAPLPVWMAPPPAARVASAERIDAGASLARRWRVDAERPPPRAPPTLLGV